MSKHRTKAQKLKIAEKRSLVTPTLAAQSQTTTSETPIKASLNWSNSGTQSPIPTIVKTPIPASFNWRFSPSLIYQDLFKTALASALIVGILLLIYYLSFSR